MRSACMKLIALFCLVSIAGAQTHRNDYSPKQDSTDYIINKEPAKIDFHNVPDYYNPSMAVPTRKNTFGYDGSKLKYRGNDSTLFTLLTTPDIMPGNVALVGVDRADSVHTFATIQGAVASSATTIIVYPGTYTIDSTLTITSKNIYCYKNVNINVTGGTANPLTLTRTNFYGESKWDFTGTIEAGWKSYLTFNYVGCFEFDTLSTTASLAGGSGINYSFLKVASANATTIRGKYINVAFNNNGLVNTNMAKAILIRQNCPTVVELQKAIYSSYDIASPYFVYDSSETASYKGLLVSCDLGSGGESNANPTVFYSISTLELDEFAIVAEQAYALTPTNTIPNDAKIKIKTFGVSGTLQTFTFITTCGTYCSIDIDKTLIEVVDWKEGEVDRAFTFCANLNSGTVVNLGYCNLAVQDFNYECETMEYIVFTGSAAFVLNVDQLIISNTISGTSGTSLIYLMKPYAGSVLNIGKLTLINTTDDSQSDVSACVFLTSNTTVHIGSAEITAPYSNGFYITGGGNTIVVDSLQAIMVASSILTAGFIKVAPVGTMTLRLSGTIKDLQGGVFMYGANSKMRFYADGLFLIGHEPVSLQTGFLQYVWGGLVHVE